MMNCGNLCTGLTISPNMERRSGDISLFCRQRK